MNNVQMILVVGQFTINGLVSLIAENSAPGIKKGDVIKRISRKAFSKMRNPKQCRLFVNSGRIECVIQKS